MHPRFEKRVATVLRERERALFASLAALAEAIDGDAGVPPVLVRALRELGTALSICSSNEQGRLTQLKLLSVALPILDNVMHALAARYSMEAAAMLDAIANLTGEAGGAQAPG